MNKRNLGAAYEERAAAYLTEQGLCIEEKNYRCPAGEIDLVARDGGYYVFIEVKYRAGEGSGDPLEAVNARKRRVISRAARYYLVRHAGTLDVPCRFDVVGFRGAGEPCWVKNAFEYIEA